MNNVGHIPMEESPVESLKTALIFEKIIKITDLLLAISRRLASSALF